MFKYNHWRPVVDMNHGTTTRITFTTNTVEKYEINKVDYDVIVYLRKSKTSFFIGQKRVNLDCRLFLFMHVKPFPTL